MNKAIPRIGFVSLGCPKATVDSEHILTRMRAEGYEISSNYEDADLVVINTCGFINSAVAESLEAIGEALQENGKVIVTGCLGAKGDIVRQTYPEVLAVTGPHAADEVMNVVHQHLPRSHDPYVDLVPPQGVRLTPQHYAYLKISEGCNHSCSFCIIPALRGELVSRPIHEIMNEAEKLVESGVKELLVISQDTSAYGLDVKYRTGFWNGKPLKTSMTELANALGSLGVWTRLHYVYPYPGVDEVIPLMAEGKILPYLDIPFQHANERILKLMKRPASSENVLKRIQQWRSICPDIILRSTFIVGFPGETEEEFEELLDFIEAAQLDRVGAFTYSPVEGAAANELPDHIEPYEQEDRLARLMYLQEGISAAKLEKKIGQTMTVLVDAVDEDGSVTRSAADAPEIDGQVLIEDEVLEVGEFVTVRITDSDEHDLWGEVM